MTLKRWKGVERCGEREWRKDLEGPRRGVEGWFRRAEEGSGGRV